MKKKNHFELSVRDKVKELPEAKMFEAVGKIVFRHCSPREKEQIKEMVVASLVIELIHLQSEVKRLINDNSEMFVENEVLKEKLKKFLIRNPKSKIRNSK